jgi:Tol biopolymer transport system component
MLALCCPSIVHGADGESLRTEIAVSNGAQHSTGSPTGELSNTVVAICTVDRHGKGLDVLVKEPAPGLIRNGSPQWSFDGKKIAFDSVTVDENWSRSRIFVVMANGTDRHKATDLGYGVAPCWSPDDRQITFQLNAGNPDGVRPGIWTMNADGSGREWLSEGSAPRWSPKGDLIACTNHLGNVRAVLLLNPATAIVSKSIRLPSKSRLTWAPDGKRLLFAPAMPNGNELFWVIDVNNPTDITHLGRLPAINNLPSNWGYPSWSPDGNQIVFQMFSPKPPALFSIDANDAVSQPVSLDILANEAAFSPDSKRVTVSCEVPRSAPLGLQESR